MRVGAVMPHFRQWEFIEEAIASVRPQVDDLLVVHDGCGREGKLPDGTPYINLLDNQGTAAAINAGQDILTQDNPDLDWLTWVSSDNTYRDNWMATLKAAVDDKTGVVYSAYRWYRPEDGREFEVHEGYKPTKLINSPDNCFFGPSFIIRRDVWEKAGPHRGRISHDYDHWLRVEEACWDMGLEIRHVDEVLCDYRAHNQRVTVTRRHEFDARKWQAEALERRKNR